MAAAPTRRGGRPHPSAAQQQPGALATAYRTRRNLHAALRLPAPGTLRAIAQALGYHDKSTTHIATKAGTPWKNYAPGDHTP